MNNRTYEPRHDKTNKMSVRPAKTQKTLDAQADLSLRWAHTHFVGFDMSRLIFERLIFEGGGPDV